MTDSNQTEVDANGVFPRMKIQAKLMLGFGCVIVIFMGVIALSYVNRAG